MVDLISVLAALAGLVVIFLMNRNREPGRGSGGRNLVILAAIALTLAVLFTLGDALH